MDKRTEPQIHGPIDGKTHICCAPKQYSPAGSNRERALLNSMWIIKLPRSTSNNDRLFEGWLLGGTDRSER